MKFLYIYVYIWPSISMSILTHKDICVYMYIYIYYTYISLFNLNNLWVCYYLFYRWASKIERDEVFGLKYTQKTAEKKNQPSWCLVTPQELYDHCGPRKQNIPFYKEGVELGLFRIILFLIIQENYEKNAKTEVCEPSHLRLWRVQRIWGEKKQTSMKEMQGLHGKMVRGKKGYSGCRGTRGAWTLGKVCWLKWPQIPSRHRQRWLKAKWSHF